MNNDEWLEELHQAVIHLSKTDRLLNAKRKANKQKYEQAKRTTEIA